MSCSAFNEKSHLLYRTISYAQLNKQNKQGTNFQLKNLFIVMPMKSQWIYAENNIKTLSFYE